MIAINSYESLDTFFPLPKWLRLTICKQKPELFTIPVEES